MSPSDFLLTTLQLLLLPVAAVFGLLLLLFTSLQDCTSGYQLPLARLLTRVLPVVLGAGKRLKPPTSIVITGASTGFGEALALHYAKPGVSLALTGRNAERLKAVASACEARRAPAASRQPPFPSSHPTSPASAARL